MPPSHRSWGLQLKRKHQKPSSFWPALMLAEQKTLLLWKELSGFSFKRLFFTYILEKHLRKYTRKQSESLQYADTGWLGAVNVGVIHFLYNANTQQVNTVLLYGDAITWHGLHVQHYSIIKCWKSLMGNMVTLMTSNNQRHLIVIRASSASYVDTPRKESCKK